MLRSLEKNPPHVALAEVVEFHMGRHRKYYTGRYALVDKTRRNIWINIDDPDLALSICEVFASKLTLAVFDLEIFKNYSADPPTIDSDVCLTWQVAPAVAAELVSLSIYDHPTVATVTEYNDLMLINHPVPSLLSKAQQLELQEQIMLYIQLRQCQFMQPDMYHDEPAWQSLCLQLLEKINDVFMTEIYLEKIEQDLIDWACQHCKNNILLIKLLHFFGRLYA